jgi:hypothetical protein
MGEQETSRTAEEQDQPRGEQSQEEQDQPQDSSGEERDFDQEVEDAKKEVKDLEEDPPEKLEDWPTGRAKYETFGGPDGESPYNDSATAKLGPSDLRYHEDGTVTQGGEEVDNPEEFKGDPIPGGPTDPDAPDISGEEQEERKDQDGSSSGDEDETDD